MKMAKKVGIITMHRIINYGSALQAYATLKAVSMLGYEAELIDYIFPNKKRKIGLAGKMKSLILKAFLSVFHAGKKKNFDSFYSEYYNCSKPFRTPEELKEADFSYDILMTGSDQVWNPMHTGDDLSFLLSFSTDNTPKISYASSFSKSVLPEEYKITYAECLKNYKSISVRETSGVNIVRELIDKTPYCACDPTLLMSGEEWSILANKGKQLVKGKYVLLYILAYAYNPYPDILNIIEYIRGKMNLPVVILDGSLMTNRIAGAKIIKSAGPLEFLRLVRDAAFVVTTSFHGTAFSLNFEKPFFSILNDDLKGDTRMLDLLKAVGAEDRALIYNAPVVEVPLYMDYNSISPRVESIRKESMDYLNVILNKV